MNKPTKQILTYYNYIECRDYIEKKYSIDSSTIHAGFWRWLIHNFHISNNSHFQMWEEWWEDCADDAEDSEWDIPEAYKQIVKYFIEEFGEGEPGSREINFQVSW